MGWTLIKILSTRQRDNGLIHAEIEWTEDGVENPDTYAYAVGNIPADADPEEWCNRPENYERIATDASRKFVMNDGEWKYNTPIDKDGIIADLAARLEKLETRVK